MGNLVDDQFCPFCNVSNEREIIAESVSAFAIYDKYPVSPGHALVIPNQHIGDYFELSVVEQIDCWELVNKVKGIISGRFNPDGYNIGINVGHSAGQTVPHVHIHIIPRYKGDLERPEGGVRGVIPGKRIYK